MKITAIHGQSHQGVTYTMTQAVLHNLATAEDEIREFFLPADGPGFCHGCFTCFMKGEAFCPSADQVQPIATAIEWADVIILDSPNYVLEMSGAMKNLMDHLAYRWITHRPHPSMFTKTGLAVVSSAGAPPGGVARSMAKQLRWLGIPKVYTFALATQTMRRQDLKPEKRNQIEKKAAGIAEAIKYRVLHPHSSLRNRFLFNMFRKMQANPDAAWNPTDRNWWIDQGWTTDRRPWKGEK